MRRKWYKRFGCEKRSEDYAELTKPIHQKLFNAAVFLCGDRPMAADLTQEALLRGFEAFDTFRENADVYPWLVRILRNIYLDHKKSSQRRYEIVLESIPDTPSGATSPLSLTIAAQERERILQAISRLPPDFALTITLIDLQGLSYSDVAEATDVPVGTVRSRLSRARIRLKELLSKPTKLSTVSSLT